MKFLICVVFAFAAVQAAPNAYYGYAAAPAVAVAPIATQGTYHAQDELGGYSFGHHEPNQIRSETKDAFGVVRGSYSYANADGTIVTNNYIADENGFRSSLAPSNGPLLPVVGKAPKVPVAIAHADIAPYPAAVPVRALAAATPAATVLAAPAPVAAPLVKAEQPIVKVSGGHVAPVLPTQLAYNYSPYSSYGYGYGYPTYQPYGHYVW